MKSRENSDCTLRGREDFVAVDWETALDLVADENRRIRERYSASGIFNGSYRWSSAGRVNHARTLIRRFYFQGSGVDHPGDSAGIAPASYPEVALVVMINHPTAGDHFGGSVAAPVFGNIMGPVLEHMNIAPDDIYRKPASGASDKS